jgi:uncharacterized protein YjiS (DUF1127 family)
MIPGSLDARPIALPTFTQQAAQNALRGFLHTVSVWHTRARQRHVLAVLDDHILRDIGLTRVDADREARKPFWRA